MEEGYLSGRIARINLDAHALRFLSEKLHQVTQTDDEVAVVVLLGNDRERNLTRSVISQEEYIVLHHWGTQDVLERVSSEGNARTSAVWRD